MQVGKYIHALRINFQIPVAPGRVAERFVHSYLVYGKEICLIDSGVAGSDTVILDYISKTGGKPDEISTLILTHSHPDHLGSARALTKATHCAISAHRAEQPWIEDVDLQFQERPVPGFHTLVGGPVVIDRFLQDGDTLDFGNGVKLEIIHTPGHSRGSISLLFPGERALFSGDAIPLPGEMPIYEDIGATVRSLKKLRSLSNLDLLLSSWDEPRRGGQIHRVMDEGLGYLQTIHQAVMKVAGDDRSLDSMELCQRVVAELGLPNTAVNVLVAKSFESNYRAIVRGDVPDFR